MTKNNIRTIGHFLAFYESDLNYIKKFRLFMSKAIKAEEYCYDCEYSFSTFLSLFRIARNIGKDDKLTALELARKWCSGGKCYDVDRFATSIQKSGISGGDFPVSLASKILFLNSPHEVMPYDMRAKNTVGYSGNNYQEFKNRVLQFKRASIGDLKYCIEDIKRKIHIIEDDFRDIPNLKVVRENRMLDKMLWVNGGN